MLVLGVGLGLGLGMGSGLGFGLGPVLDLIHYFMVPGKYGPTYISAAS